MCPFSVKNRKFRFYCVENAPEPCAVIIFGASGDLTKRMIMPALFKLFDRGLMPSSFFVIGCARSRLTDETFRDIVRSGLENPLKADEFLRSVFYLPLAYDSSQDYRELKKRIQNLDARYGTDGNYLFYLATPPALFTPIAANLDISGLTEEQEEHSYTRVIVEKPFGRDIDSALKLNRDLHRFLKEHQIYRIDHYLGKETVQNILMLRFANMVFEPVWNRQYIDHVQITASEHMGIGHRAGYYDSSGCMRDMFQNHMMQMLALVAMEAASSFDADRIRDEKVKVIRSMRQVPIDDIEQYVIRGQYGSGTINGAEIPAYTDESGVDGCSRTETFAALKLFIDNWRWRDVPFYLRSGKRLREKMTRISIVFKRIPHSMFRPFPSSELSRNILELNVQPEDGFSLSIQAKHPGPKLCMSTLAMDFKYKKAFGFDMPDAYERLMLDCMQGDQTLFVRNDTLEESWMFFTPVLQAWENTDSIPLHAYAPGTWGPTAARDLIEHDGREWMDAP